jgi:hypothetical protein
MSMLEESLAARRWSDVTSAGIWVGSRLSVFIAATYASWAFTGTAGVFIGGPGELEPERGPLTLWDRWDVDWYRSIAEQGYLAPGHEANIAFPPGLPMLMRSMHLMGVDASVAGLLISLVAGLVAAVALGRLTQDAGGLGPLGVVAWVAAPMAVFLAAPYAESLFAAFAFWAWMLAKRGLWIWAGALAGLATLVRVNGLFLGVGLLVMFATSSRRTWVPGLALLLPFVAVGTYVTYQHSLTGSWSAWLDAQRAGWGREFGSPLEAFTTTYEMAFTNGVSSSFAVQYRLELICMAALLIFIVILAVKRWWAEFTYVALTSVALGTSTLFYSVPRSMLTLFPIWVLFGVWMSKHRSVAVAYLAVCLPLMFVGTAAFAMGRWVA